MSSGTKRGSDEPSAEGGQKKSKQTSLLSLFSGTAAGSTNISSTACSNTNSPPAPAAQQSSGGGANASGTDTHASDAVAGLPAAPDAAYDVHYSTVDADDEGSVAGSSDDEESVTEPDCADDSDDLRQLLNAGNTPIISVGEDGNIVVWSDRAAKMTGFTEDDAVGASLVDKFVPPSLRTSLETILANVHVGNPICRFNLELLTMHNGRTRRLVVDVTSNRQSMNLGNAAERGIVTIHFTEAAEPNAAVLGTYVLEALGRGHNLDPRIIAAFIRDLVTPPNVNALENNNMPRHSTDPSYPFSNLAREHLNRASRAVEGNRQDDKFFIERAWSILSDADDETSYADIYSSLDDIFTSDGKGHPRWKKFLDQCLIPGSPVEIGLRKIRNSSKNNSGNKTASGKTTAQKLTNDEEWEQMYALLPANANVSKVFWLREKSDPTPVPESLQNKDNVFHNYTFQGVKTSLSSSKKKKKKGNTGAKKTNRPEGISIVKVTHRRVAISRGGYLKVRLERRDGFKVKTNIFA